MVANAKTVKEFDEGLTRVSFGFKSADDYYMHSSSADLIKHVQTPSLCIQDPFFYVARVCEVYPLLKLFLAFDCCRGFHTMCAKIKCGIQLAYKMKCVDILALFLTCLIYWT